MPEFLTTTQHFALPRIVSRFAWMVALLVVAASGAAAPRPCINELAYAPAGDTNQLEFIEVINPGTDPIDIGGYRFVEGVTFTIPDGTILPAGGYFCVVASMRAFRARYGEDVPAAGDFEGKLNDGGERIKFADRDGRIVDALEYDIGGDWPPVEGTFGLTLEKVNPLLPSDYGSSWDSCLVDGGTPGAKNTIFLEALNQPRAKPKKPRRKPGGEDDERRSPEELVATDREGGLGAEPAGEAVVTSTPQPYNDAPKGFASFDPAAGAAQLSGKPTAVLFSMRGPARCAEQLDALRNADLATKLPHVRFVYADTRADRKLARDMGILRVPTWVFLDPRGERIDTLPAVLPASEIESKVRIYFPPPPGAPR